MADQVKPVFVPPAGSTPTPGKDIGKNIGTDQYWRDKALEARARREYEEETHNIESIRNPQPQEPAVKMSGEINLGKIDFQEQARKAQEQVEIARQAAETRNAKLEEENNQLKNQLLTTTINNMQTNLSGQIQKLQAELAAGKGNSKSVGDALKEIIDNAAVLGYVRPETSPKTPVMQSAGDAAISLEMLRLQLEDKRTERTFAWQMEKDRRNFSIELKKLDQANRLAQADSQAKADRDKMIWKTPEVLGGFIAKGLLAARGGGVASDSEPVQRRPAKPRSNIESQPPATISNEAETEMPHQVEAGLGEAGSIECPSCGGTIAIGPTATKGVCAGCDFTIDVIRKGTAG